MPDDDLKLKSCLDFILNAATQRETTRGPGVDATPVFVGVNGVQGCGKTTLVSALAQELDKYYHDHVTVVLSVDDLYLTRKDQAELASKHPSNPLIQHRGQPSTHDLKLAVEIFDKLQHGHKIPIPSYDKSAFDGLGDRVSMEQWKTVNDEGQAKAKFVIFEGWCVGIRALENRDLEDKWRAAISERAKGEYVGRLGSNDLEDVQFVNKALKDYDRITNQLDVLIHLDAEETPFVYAWRLEQERHLWQTKGSGMTDSQVKAFVDGYYPAYELYTDSLRAGAFPGCKDRQLRIVIGRQREVKAVIEL